MEKPGRRNLAIWTVVGVIGVALVVAFLKDGKSNHSAINVVSQLSARKSSIPDTSNSPDVPFGLTLLSESDQASALTQRNCPVYDDLLGTMERVHKITFRGEPVWICCPGCEETFLENAEIYLKKIEIFKLGGFASTEDRQPWINQFLPQAWQFQSHIVITQVEFPLESRSPTHSQDVIDLIQTLPDLEKVILSGRTSVLAPTLNGVFRIDSKALKQKLPNHAMIHMIIG